MKQKTIKVGIPQGLLYYQFYPAWKTFFEELGAEVIVSPPTTREILAWGSSRMVAETCLPVKVFCGHVIWLSDKCDFLFIPGVRSLEEGTFSCSKLLGLPDMMKAVVPKCPPVLDPDIEIPKGKKELYKVIYKLGRHFTWNPLKIKKAFDKSLETHLSYRKLMLSEKLTPPQAIERMLDGANPIENSIKTEEGDLLEIALIGHPYAIYDDYINHRLINRLERMGAKVVTPEMVAKEELYQSILKLAGKPYWSCEEDVVGGGGYYLEKADGVIGVVPFGCGPDSAMTEVLYLYTKRNKSAPFMILTLDEHSGEAGMITRLEAFIDMIRWRRKRPSKM